MVHQDQSLWKKKHNQCNIWKHVVLFLLITVFSNETQIKAFFPSKTLCSFFVLCCTNFGNFKSYDGDTFLVYVEGKCDIKNGLGFKKEVYHSLKQRL